MKTVPLGQVADFVNGFAFKPSDWHEDGLPIVRIQNLTDHSKPINRTTRPVDSKFVVRRGELLVSWSATLGVFEWKRTDEALVNQHIFRVIPRKNVEVSYLRHMLADALVAMERHLHGATMRHVNRREFLATEIPLPSVDEQRRIAAILDHADALRAKHQEIQTHLRELTAAAFRERFGPSSWMAVTTKPLSAAKSVHPWVSLSSVARLATGHTPSRDNPGYWDGDIPWISLPDIRALDGQITFDTTLHVTAAGIKNSSAVLLPRGTVCFSRTASLGFVTIMGAPMATSQDFHNWVPGPEIDSTYLREALRISRAHLIASSDGSTHRTIYQRTAETFHVMLPPRDEQLAYADAVAAFQAQAERNTRVLIDAEELFSSLRARAFSGRL